MWSFGALMLGTLSLGDPVRLSFFRSPKYGGYFGRDLMWAQDGRPDEGTPAHWYSCSLHVQMCRNLR